MSVFYSVGVGQCQLVSGSALLGATSAIARVFSLAKRKNPGYEVGEISGN